MLLEHVQQDDWRSASYYVGPDGIVELVQGHLEMDRMHVETCDTRSAREEKRKENKDQRY